MKRKIKILPRDIIAAILIVGGLVLLALGKDGTVSAILMAIAAFYFGSEHIKASDQKK